MGVTTGGSKWGINPSKQSDFAESSARSTVSALRDRLGNPASTPTYVYHWRKLTSRMVRPSFKVISIYLQWRAMSMNSTASGLLRQAFYFRNDAVKLFDQFA